MDFTGDTVFGIASKLNPFHYVNSTDTDKETERRLTDIVLEMQRLAK
jgi:hypothetical protein